MFAQHGLNICIAFLGQLDRYYADLVYYGHLSGNQIEFKGRVIPGNK